MLLEFDADQRLWQETVRDAVTKQCPPSLVRSIALRHHGQALCQARPGGGTCFSVQLPLY